jgi:hypothetical protein
MATDPKREFLRHTIATLAYRCGKTLRDAPENFPDFRIAVNSRTPAEILAHNGDLIDWVLSQAKGSETWHGSKPLPWDKEVARFFAALEALDAYLASDAPLAAPVEKLFQGAIADALTHTGQLALLRRLAGAPVKGENYSRANITPGRVGPDQPAPVGEFD